MGCDIHSFAEIKKDNKWVQVTEPIFPPSYSFGEYAKGSVEPFGARNYSIFGFLANVRNGAKIPGFTTNGLPDDSDAMNKIVRGGISVKQEIKKNWNYHSLSHLYLKQLLDYNYGQVFENKRRRMVYSSPGITMMGSIFDIQHKGGGGMKMSVANCFVKY